MVVLFMKHDFYSLFSFIILFLINQVHRGVVTDDEYRPKDTQSAKTKGNSDENTPGFGILQDKRVIGCGEK
jgi:hypothetical protein